MSDMEAITKAKEETKKDIGWHLSQFAAACAEVDRCIGEIIESRHADDGLLVLYVWSFADALQDYNERFTEIISAKSYAYQHRSRLEEFRSELRSGIAYPPLERELEECTCKVETWQDFFGNFGSGGCIEEKIDDAMHEFKHAMAGIDIAAFLSHDDDSTLRELARKVRGVGGICETYAEKLEYMDESYFRTRPERDDPPEDGPWGPC